MMLLLKKLLLVACLITTFFSDQMIYLFLIFISTRIYNNSKSNLISFLNYMTEGEIGFTSIYLIWLLRYGNYVLQYIPLIIYYTIIWIQLKQQQVFTPPLTKHKILKEELIFLKNKIEILILVYQLISIFSNFSDFWKVMILCFMMKIKYKFSPHLQSIFHNMHVHILKSLYQNGPLTTLYRGVYKTVCFFGNDKSSNRIIYVKSN